MDNLGIIYSNNSSEVEYDVTNKYIKNADFSNFNIYDTNFGWTFHSWGDIVFPEEVEDEYKDNIFENEGFAFNYKPMDYFVLDETEDINKVIDSINSQYNTNIDKTEVTKENLKDVVDSLLSTVSTVEYSHIRRYNNNNNHFYFIYKSQDNISNIHLPIISQRLTNLTPGKYKLFIRRASEIITKIDSTHKPGKQYSSIKITIQDGDKKTYTLRPNIVNDKNVGCNQIKNCPSLYKMSDYDLYDTDSKLYYMNIYNTTSCVEFFNYSKNQQTADNFLVEYTFLITNETNYVDIELGVNSLVNVNKGVMVAYKDIALKYLPKKY